MKQVTYNLLSTLVLLVVLTSCQNDKIKINGRFIGGDSKMVYLEVFNAVDPTVIDSATMDNEGNFKFAVKADEDSPKLYNVVYNFDKIPLFLEKGASVKIDAIGSVTKNYTVEGSEESALVREFYQGYIAGMQELDRIAAIYADKNTKEEERKELAKEYSEKYNKIKRDQLKFIIENKEHLAAVYALYQRLPNDTHLFSGSSDVIYYRTVADALEAKYPESSYLARLKAEIKRFDALTELNSNIKEMSYPDIDLKDMYGKSVKLSSLDGKVILLDFWSAQLANDNGRGNVANAELKEIYNKYKGEDFEIYQVAIDNSKAAWISAVQEQKLPWVSVSDLRGYNSTLLTLYNITRLPSNFLISKSGDLVMRDIFGDELEKQIEAELAK